MPQSTKLAPSEEDDLELALHLAGVGLCISRTVEAHRVRLIHNSMSNRRWN